MTTNRTIRLVVLLAGMMGLQAAPAAQAQTTREGYSWPGIAAGVKVGTLGLGADLTLPVVPDRLNLRLNGNYMDFSYKGTANDIDYTFTLDFKDLLLVGDWHPFANNFRITAGAIWNGSSKVKLEGTPTDDVKIGDHDYPPEAVGTLSGSLDFESVAPYFGIGFGNAIGPYEQTWSFVFDLGVIIQTFDSTLTASGPAMAFPEFRADMKKQQDDLQDSLDQFKVYPVLQFGVAYHF